MTAGQDIRRRRRRRHGRPHGRAPPPHRATADRPTTVLSSKCLFHLYGCYCLVYGFMLDYEYYD